MPEFAAEAEIPSFSFRYGGNSSTELLGGWKKEVSTEEAAGGKITHIAYADPVTGLCATLHVRRFDDFPAVDWLVEFENRGPADTPILEDILPIDVCVPMSPTERLRLHHANGSSCRADDFLPQVSELPPGGRKVLAPQGGRSSNGVLPFMNLQRCRCGMVLAVGWSGQWSASFDRDRQRLRVSAGMERTHLLLHPGEKIRTPRILVMDWEGEDDSLGSNLLRRLLLAHYLPRIDGDLVMPPSAQCLQGYFYLTGEAGEQLEMTALPKVASLGAEAYWIDACWYGQGGQWWQEVGSWVVDRERFPRGLKPIADAAHKAGMKFVLWFEPERVRAGSLLEKEHPEFLLASEKDPDNLLLNLGLPEARMYITELLSRLIADNGVDIYRQDFNFDPLCYWQSADAPDRVGMTEIRYVEGHYQFWDELRRRHGKLWIDNCASGGRRIDLETLSRSLPLWASDFVDVIGLAFGMGLHVGDQCINAGLARWVPLFGGGVWNFTPYGTRGQIIGGFTFGFHIPREDYAADDRDAIVDFKQVLARGKTLLGDEFPLAEARAAIAEWKSLRPFFLGDFHLLLPLTVSDHDWCCYQFHRQDLGGGFAMFFRRHRSPFSTMAVELKCVDASVQYGVSLSSGYQEAPRKRISGEELRRLTVTIPEMPGSLLLRYSQAE